MTISLTKKDLQLKKAAEEVKSNDTATGQSLIKLGKLLQEYKETSKHFIKYVEQNLGLSYWQAQISIKAYLLYEAGKIEKKATLSEIYMTIGALKKLSNEEINTYDKKFEVTQKNDTQVIENKELSDSEKSSSTTEPEITEDDWEPINSPMSVEARVIDNDKTPRDRFNQDIPVVLEPIFGEVAQQFKLWKKQLSVIKQEMNKRSGEFGYESLEARYIKTRFDNLYELIRLAEPYSVCIVCQGDGGTGSNCKTCNSKGWITEPIYNAIPAEFKIGLQTK